MYVSANVGRRDDNDFVNILAVHVNSLLAM
jgi:hypothetical protein